VAADDTAYPEYHRREVVARYGHFRIDRLWFRTKRPGERGAKVYYDVVFEVDTEGEFDLGRTTASRIHSPSELRQDAYFFASIWRRAHSPPPEGRPTSVPYYSRRVGPLDAEHEVSPEGWHQDSAFWGQEKPTIDVDEASALLEAALHALEETESGKG
jgi:hypothetical protein